MKRPLILVANDDGISAPGIRNLIRIMNDFIAQNKINFEDNDLKFSTKLKK